MIHLMKHATLCYVQQDGHTLMMLPKNKAGAYAGKWNGLGGKMDRGESPEEGVIREVQEESGLLIEPQLRGHIVFPAWNKEDDDWYTHIFTAKQFTGEIVGSAEGTPEWIPDEKLLDLNLWEGDKYIFEWIRAGKFFSGKLVYDENSHVVEHAVHFYDPSSF